MSNTQQESPIECPKCHSKDVALKNNTGEILTGAAFEMLTGAQMWKTQQQEARRTIDVVCKSCGNEFEYDTQKLLKHHGATGGKTTKIVLFVVLGLLAVLGLIIYFVVKSQGGNFQMPK